VSLELLCPFVQLTPRESDVARLLLRGYSNKEIGGVLGIPDAIVKNILQRIFKKCGINLGEKRIKLVVLLHQNGISCDAA